MRIIMIVMLYVFGMVSVAVAVGTGVLAALRVFFGRDYKGDGRNG